MDDKTLRTVVVHTVAGHSIKGNLVTKYDDAAVLIEARVLLDEGMSQQLNGEVIIERRQVHFITTVPPEAS
jgi:hypothetical protein